MSGRPRFDHWPHAAVPLRDAMTDSPGESVMSRRDILRLMALGGLGTALIGPRLFAQPATPLATRARSVIQIWMWGGPSHLDTFDPKPEAGPDYCGPLVKPIPTNVDDIHIGELLPLLAQQADKYSIIRGMTHGNNGHETAAYMAQTGWMPGGALVHPGLGAVVSLKKGYDAGYRGLIPPYVVLTRLQGRFAEAGFLGQRYSPFATGGNPAAKRFAVEGIVSKDLTPERQQSRRALLSRLDTFRTAMTGVQDVAIMAKAEAEAWDLILGSAGKVFDLEQEKPELRDRYGNNPFGQSCLAARRLVESGVPYVTINYEGWDSHKQHFNVMKSKLPQFDKGLATLLEDLDDRGLLSNTLVWCQGEFGRTPKVDWDAPWNGGRSHFGKVFSAVVAGGGFEGGQVVGASNKTGEDVKERPVYPWDLLASIYTLLGIDPNGRIPHPQGYEVPILPPAEEKLTRGGLLKEIM